MTAYDYISQQWVHGEAARRLLIAQAREDISLALLAIRGHEGGRTWLADMGVSAGELIADRERRLAELEVSL